MEGEWWVNNCIYVTQWDYYVTLRKVKALVNFKRITGEAPILPKKHLYGHACDSLYTMATNMQKKKNV